jgi:acetyltransferase-like isoleucine patch superfamily enzyme
MEKEKMSPGMHTNPELIDISPEMFALLTRYANLSENEIDDRKRADLMGFDGRKAMVAPGAIIRVDPKLIGSNVYVGLYCYLNGKVTVGNNVLIGPHCSLTAGHHKFDPVTGWFSERTEKDGDDSISIGDGCWLASGVTITAGVKVGRANLICAHAVVTKNTPDYAIMAGIPARQVGHIDPMTGEYFWYQNIKEPKTQEDKA